MNLIHRILRFLIIAAVGMTAAMTISADVARPGAGAASSAGGSASDTTLTASLITCYPGPEIYELCGHEALRIRGGGIDSVWNYGVFDFREPNFVGRFVKGETDYMLVGYPFAWFMPEYIARGSKVVEQDLNLTPGEVARLRALLQREQLPLNRRYRYNYIRDNCATRIVSRLQEATDSTIMLSDTVRYASFREAMRHYHRNYPWYQFGIDLALGSGIDHRLLPGEQMFAPMEMMRDARSMRFHNGHPLVKAERVLYAGNGDATLGPTPWWLTPLSVGIAILAVTLCVCIADFRRKRISRWWWSIYFGATGLAGILITYLVFVSTHDSTSPNMMILWLNPLQLVIAVGVWLRRAEFAVTAMSWLDVIVMSLLLFSWPMIGQSANPAVFPMIASGIMLSASWAIITRKQSYNMKSPKRKKK